MRKKIADSAQKGKLKTIPEAMQEVCVKVEKVLFNWAKLIARIYETDPLICTLCGKKIKIVAFVTHTAEIRRILSGIGWSYEPPKFDPEYELHRYDICQLIPGTTDGFHEIESQLHSDTGPDPTGDYPDLFDLGHDQDSPHCEAYCNPPHWEE